MVISKESSILDSIVNEKLHELKSYVYIRNNIMVTEDVLGIVSKNVGKKMREIGEPKGISYDNDVRNENPISSDTLYNEVISYEKDMIDYVKYQKKKLFQLEEFVQRFENKTYRNVAIDKYFNSFTWDQMEAMYRGKPPYVERHGMENGVKNEIKKVIYEDIKKNGLYSVR